MKFFFVSLIVTAAIGCTTDKRPASGDSTKADSQGTVAASTPAVSTGWSEIETGPVLLLPSSENGVAASVVNPMLNDSLLISVVAASVDSLSGLAVELFDRAGLVSVSRLSARVPSTAAEGCLAWPVMSLAELNQRQWQVGFRKGLVTPLSLDSLEGFSSSDSMAVTAELARLASALPTAGDSAFQGLPFSVRRAYRASSSQPPLLIGDIVRKINEEANPREEHLLLIAEKAGGSGSPYHTVFHTRAAGSEEQVRTTEILAAGRLVHSGRIILVISFGYENGSRAALLERPASSQWRITWRSAYTGC